MGGGYARRGPRACSLGVIIWAMLEVKNAIICTVTTTTPCLPVCAHDLSSSLFSFSGFPHVILSLPHFFSVRQLT